MIPVGIPITYSPQLPFHPAGLELDSFSWISEGVRIGELCGLGVRTPSGKSRNHRLAGANAIEMASRW